MTETATLTEQQANLFNKIRGLLKKAESTTFEEEANSFLAKAQELMIKYRVDEATLWATDVSRREEVTEVTIEIKDKSPGSMYRRKILLKIAKLSSCRMYYMPGQDKSVVVGFPKDLIWVEMLYTSISKQGSFRMAMAQGTQGRGIHTRTFRHSFWLGFGEKITERLEAAYNESLKTVAYTGSQALVLSDRKKQVDDWVNQNLKLGRGRDYDNRTRNTKAQHLGSMAAETVNITGGAATNISTKRQGELT